MQDMSVFWLRAAVALYAVGLFHTIQIAIRQGASIFRPALIAFSRRGRAAHGRARRSRPPREPFSTRRVSTTPSPFARSFLRCCFCLLIGGIASRVSACFYFR